MNANAGLVAAIGGVIALISTGCGPRVPDPPPRVGREDAGMHLSRSGKGWVLAAEDQGVLQGDPLGVVSFRVREETVFSFARGAEPHRTVARDEVFAMASGAELHCTVEGSLPLAARAFWKGREVWVTLESAGGRLPRRCTGGAFPAKVRDVGAWSAVYVLRDDRLVPVEPPTVRDVLLPQ